LEKGIREELALFLIRNHRTKREHVFILYFRSGMEKSSSSMQVEDRGKTAHW
jgi:hypothetical protein